MANIVFINACCGPTTIPSDSDDFSHGETDEGNARLTRSDQSHVRYHFVRREPVLVDEIRCELRNKNQSTSTRRPAVRRLLTSNPAKRRRIAAVSEDITRFV